MIVSDAESSSIVRKSCEHVSLESFHAYRDKETNYKLQHQTPSLSEVAGGISPTLYRGKSQSRAEVLQLSKTMTRHSVILIM